MLRLSHCVRADFHGRQPAGGGAALGRQRRRRGRSGCRSGCRRRIARRPALRPRARRSRRRRRGEPRSMRHQRRPACVSSVFASPLSLHSRDRRARRYHRPAPRSNDTARPRGVGRRLAAARRHRCGRRNVASAIVFLLHASRLGGGSASSGEKGQVTRIRQHSAARVHDGLSGDWVPIEELTALELFKSTKRPFKVKLASNFAPKPDSNEPAIKAAVRREYEKGEVICEAGAYGSTAFLLLEGSATAFVPETMRAATVPGRTRSLALDPGAHLPPPLAGAGGAAAGAGRDRRDQRATRPSPAPARRPRTLLRAGDLFGIDTCVNFYPREATVRAEERCVVIEMLRSVLDTIRDAGSAGRRSRRTTRASAIRHEAPAERAARRVLRGDARGDRGGGGAADAGFRRGAQRRHLRGRRAGGRASSWSAPAPSSSPRTKAGGELIFTYLGRGGAFGFESLAAAGRRDRARPALHVAPGARAARARRPDHDRTQRGLRGRAAGGGSRGRPAALPDRGARRRRSASSISTARTTRC